MPERGFTLVEVLIATILVGLAIVSLVAANRSFTDVNAGGAYLSTAEFLIEQLRELTTLLPVVDPQSGTSVFGAEEANWQAYDDLDDFDGAQFKPPINADSEVLYDLAAFSQHIRVENVRASDFDDTSIGQHNSNFVRVTVRVILNSKEISSASWIRARLE